MRHLTKVCILKYKIGIVRNDCCTRICVFEIKLHFNLITSKLNFNKQTNNEIQNKKVSIYRDTLDLKLVKIISINK